MSGIDEDAERRVFESEFRSRTLVIAIGSNEVDQFGAVASVMSLAEQLTDGQTRVAIVAPRSALANAGSVAEAFAAEVMSMPVTTAEFAHLWMSLAAGAPVVIAVVADPALDAAELSCQLGVTKLVLTDAEGGWGISFGSIDDLRSKMRERPNVAKAALRALDGGVWGVNICRLGDLETELFTFDGAGTLFTRTAYLQVDRICVDDLTLVEGLVARGVAEGFLRERTPLEVAELAMGGLGARIRASGHLVGIGALEIDRYRADGVAEVACLYTVNRFAGEGIGGALVRGLVSLAERDAVSAVFACTVSERAASLFGHLGFVDVDLDKLPKAKWDGYDVERRKRLRALWLDADRFRAIEQGGGPS